MDSHNSTHYTKAEAAIVTAIRDKIEQDIAQGQRTSVAELARQAGMNRKRLAQIFFSLFQVTILQFQTTTRMERAKILLMQPDCSIGEVADAVGYSDAKNFKRAFKRHTKMTPKHYRDKGEKK